MYLAKAYVKQYVPGVHPPENTYLAEQAIMAHLHALGQQRTKKAGRDEIRLCALRWRLVTKG
jgi:hypothetical protein